MKIRKNIAVSENGFIFNPSTGDSYSVNHVGAYILGMLKTEQSKEDIIKSFQAEYGIDKHTAEKDFNDFLSIITSYQLIDNE